MGIEVFSQGRAIRKCT